MPRFNVTIEKLLRQSGTIAVEAVTAAAAVKQIRAMMNDPDAPLQTIDPRIIWDGPVEYVDDSLKAYGEANEEPNDDAENGVEPAICSSRFGNGPYEHETE